jgi:predicted ATPase/DNA-binding CsgD family transcriptional regulator
VTPSAICAAPRRRVRSRTRCSRQPLPVRRAFEVNLPNETSSFVGRGTQIADVANALRTARLVTVTGVAGVGKTRVALQVARAVTSEYGYIAWAPLATVADTRDVGKAVRDAVGRRERTSLEARVSVQAESSLLLILDNCEHVISGCADLVEGLLQNFASVRVLATSREPLGVPGEVVLPIAPLPLPGADDPLDDLIQNDAVELFVQRARARDPQFQLTQASGELVARICCSLDGIPLAIEFAAARISTSTVADIASGLDDPIELLTNGFRTNPRHQTLRASLDWSHALLHHSEQRLLRRLSIFDGGFTSNAVACVCATEGMPAAEIPALLEGLVAKSLVQAWQQDGTVRFGLFHAVRSYGLALLIEAGEENSVRERHLQWCLSHVERIGSGEALKTDLMGHLEREEENLRAALHWTIQQSRCIESTRLTLVLGRLWQLSGRWPEGVRSLMGATASDASSALSNPWRVPDPTIQSPVDALAESSPESLSAGEGHEMTRVSGQLPSHVDEAAGETASLLPVQEALMPVKAPDTCPGTDEAWSAGDDASVWITAACAENHAIGGHRADATVRLIEPMSASFAAWPVGPATQRQVPAPNGQHLRQEGNEAVNVEATPVAAVQTDKRPRSCALSERELEVVKLVAEGRSNREIAEELIISRKTAEAHVSHILTKLGLWRRVQIARWSMQQDLGSAAAG